MRSSGWALGAACPVRASRRALGAACLVASQQTGDAGLDEVAVCDGGDEHQRDIENPAHHLCAVESEAEPEVHIADGALHGEMQQVDAEGEASEVAERYAAERAAEPRYRDRAVDGKRGSAEDKDHAYVTKGCEAIEAIGRVERREDCQTDVGEPSQAPSLDALVGRRTGSRHRAETGIAEQHSDGEAREAAAGELVEQRQADVRYDDDAPSQRKARVCRIDLLEAPRRATHEKKDHIHHDGDAEEPRRRVERVLDAEVPILQEQHVEDKVVDVEVWVDEGLTRHGDVQPFQHHDEQGRDDEEGVELPEAPRHEVPKAHRARLESLRITAKQPEAREHEEELHHEVAQLKGEGQRERNGGGVVHVGIEVLEVPAKGDDAGSEAFEPVEGSVVCILFTCHGRRLLS